MSRRLLSTLAAAGSALLLLAALGFQYIGGLAPCDLCITQRWPHLVAVVMGVLAWFVPPRILWRTIGLLAALATAGYGLYHTGVERAWWQGPTACSGGGNVGALSPEDLLQQILAAPVVRCDAVAWEFLGLSMASWNALASLGLALLWGLSLVAPRR